MFSISIGYLRNQFSSRTIGTKVSRTSGSRLSLPLERTAKEQINYTKWMYSENFKKLISKIKKAYLVEDVPHLVQLDKASDGILLRFSKNFRKDEFFYLFDYLKDELLDKGFWLKNAVQESFTIHGKFIEVERFDLVFGKSGQEFELTIESKDGRPIEIIGRNVSGMLDEKPVERKDKVISNEILSTLSLS